MKFGNLEGIRSLAVVGATGLVGREFLSLLTENRIKIPDLRLLASKDSEGEILEFGEKDFSVEELTERSFEGVEVAFFTATTEISKEFIPVAINQGCLVVDDSSAYRMHPDVALVVPEINGARLRDYEGSVISVPNCSTTPLVMVLNHLTEFGIKRVVVSTYQSISGAGTKAFDMLSQQTISLLNGASIEEGDFPHRFAFNCIPQIGKLEDNGYYDEELKVIKETRKILGLPELKITATSVRVPTFCGHGISVNVEFEKSFGTTDALREKLDASPGLKVLDNPENFIFPTNVECVGSDHTFVGRIRQDHSVPSGLNFWVITDNLRKGAALNALQILETLYKYRRMV